MTDSEGASADRGERERPSVRRLSRSRLSRESRRQGQGAFLSDAAAEGFTPTVDVTIRVEAADEQLADALAIEPGDPVLVRDRVLSADGQPVQLAVSRLPKTITDGTAIDQVNPGVGGIYAELERAGHVLDHFVEFVSTRLATAAESRSLNLSAGKPVLAVRRIAYARDGTPVETNDMVLTGDRYELVYEISAD